MSENKVKIPYDIKGNIVVSVKSDAMAPMLRHGRDIAVFVKDREYKPGDVVLIKTPDERYLIRRVICLSEVSAVVRADRKIKGERVRKSQICGVLDCFFRDGVNRHDVADPSVKAYAKIARVVPIRF